MFTHGLRFMIWSLGVRSPHTALASSSSQLLCIGCCSPTSTSSCHSLHSSSPGWSSDKTDNEDLVLECPADTGYVVQEVVRGDLVAPQQIQSPGLCTNCCGGPTLFQWLTDRCINKTACTRDAGVSLIANPSADKRVQIWVETASGTLGVNAEGSLLATGQCWRWTA